jgi:nucleotide-binding universal stress UspA family protein
MNQRSPSASTASTCRLTLFEPSKLKPENTQRPWPPRLTRRRVAPAFQPTHAGLKLALATYQPSLRISQDDSIFPSLANLKGTGIIEPRISLLRRRCSNPEDRCSSFLLFRRIASNSIMSWCAGMAAGQPRGRSPIAMPFLTRSGKASIVVADTQSAKSADLPGADIATHLSRHGVNATIERIPVSKVDVSNAILAFAADAGADLIVMGGYGHSRLREFILGGTTRGMLASMTKPTLMSH